MKENRIIQNKMEENEYEINSNTWKRLAGIVGTVVLTGASFTAAAALHAFVPELTIPLVLFGAMFPIAGACYTKCKEEQKNSAIKQNEHLKKISNNGIIRDDTTDQKRSILISSLEEKQSELFEKMTNKSIVAGLGITTWLIGSAISLVATPAILATIGGLIVSTAAMNGLAKNEKEYFDYETRVENLKNDLFLGPLYKVNRPNYSTSTSASKPNPATNQIYNKAVDEYVERLGSNRGTTISKQKTKYR